MEEACARMNSECSELPYFQQIAICPSHVVYFRFVLMIRYKMNPFVLSMFDFTHLNYL